MIKLPTVEFGRSTDESIRNIMDGIEQLKRSLSFVLYHLDEDNIPRLQSMIGDIESNHTLIEQSENRITLLSQDVAKNTSKIDVESNRITLLSQDVANNSSRIDVEANRITLLSQDVQGNAAQIQVNAKGITSLVQSVNGHSSSITQLSNQIQLKVGYSDVISAINLSPESISITSDKINLNGVTTMNGLARISETLILGNAGALRATGNGIQILSSPLSIDGQIIAKNITAEGISVNRPGPSGGGGYGYIVVDGDITATVDVFAGGVSLRNHTHNQYCQNASNQQMSFQFYGGQLNVFVDGSLVGSAPLV